MSYKPFDNTLCKRSAARVRFGFTLIELLVVISIISMLIGILLPALSQARLVAKGILCVSNQRQMGIAHAGYQADNRESYVPYYYPFMDASSGMNYWGAAMWKYGYTSTPEVFDCPVFMQEIPSSWSDIEKADADIANSNNPFAWSDYGYNYDFVGSSQTSVSDPGMQYRPARDADLTRPSTTIVQTDSRYTAIPGRTLGYFVVIAHWNGGGPYVADARHSSAVSTLWADSHATLHNVGDVNNPYFTGLTNFYDATNFWTRTGTWPE